MNLQYNITTGTPYEGQNQAILMAEKDDNGYSADSWITYIQAKNANGKLVNAKGKGVHLRRIVTTVDKDGKEEQYPKYFVVFNTDLVV